MEDKEGRAGYASRTNNNRPVWFGMGLMAMVVVSAIIANAILFKYMMNKVNVHDYN